MNHWQLETPVVLIIFNRPEKTAKVLEVVRQAQPPKLFVIADGPRKNYPNEPELCHQARSIIEQVDWDCQIFKNYSDINLGCRKRIGGTGLPWVFEQVEEAIILEDDCLPHPSFFRFCQELLKKYRYDERIMSICGTNVMIEWKSDLQSYHFSQFFSSWGWASWRRVWKMYDADIKSWINPEIKNRIEETLLNKKQFLDYQNCFNQIYTKKIDSWAYQMLYLGLFQSCYSIIPSKNLISNMGFNSGGTNTLASSDLRANMPISEIKFPLIHPVGCMIDKEFESKHFLNFYDKTFITRIRRKLGKNNLISNK